MRFFDRSVLLWGLLPALVAAADATFTKDVAPIFQAKCEQCHRPGAMAPMPFVTYQQVRPWAKAIRERVVRRQMPPWHVDPTTGIQKFANDISLTDAEIATIARWVDAGATMGDPKHLPPPRVWPSDDDGWLLAKQFGQPDIVVKSEPYTVPAQGPDQWFKPLTPMQVDEPRWVRAVEIRPGTKAGRRVTHHVLARLVQDESQYKSELQERARGAQGPGLLMEWAVGKTYDVYRPETGKLLLPGAKIWWEVHYHAVGEAIRDHAELAIYLYPKGQQPKYRTYLTMFPATEAFGSGIDIAPRSIAHSEGERELRMPARLENFQPHMHLRGKAMQIEAILPDGSVRMLSRVDRFNFNWMINYIYTDDAAPVLPKGTRIRVKAWHDNTTANPNNPDPDQWVGFGDRTVDEMAHAWVNVTYISEEDYERWLAMQQQNKSRSSSSHR
jgi:mono/diheme cytochrome c family protein